jgi:hypothetical protein
MPSQSSPRSVRALAVAALIGAVTPGCCSIIHQTRQAVAISSTPSRARVIVDEEEQGRTPLVAKMKRKYHHTIRLELEGYEPYEMALTRKVWGNLVFGGVIGLIIDASNGALYRLTPEAITAGMTEGRAKILYKDDEMNIFVMLHATSTLERIATLRPVPAEATRRRSSG